MIIRKFIYSKYVQVFLVKVKKIDRYYMIVKLLLGNKETNI